MMCYQQRAKAVARRVGEYYDTISRLLTKPTRPWAEQPSATIRVVVVCTNAAAD